MLISRKEQCRIRNCAVIEKIQMLLPEAMAEAGIDMWIVYSREDNDDPILDTMITEVIPTPHRLVFVRENTDVLAFVLGPDVPAFRLSGFQCLSNGRRWQDALSYLLDEYRPKITAINVSETEPIADGLGTVCHRELMEVLKGRTEIVEGTPLVKKWLGYKTDSELELFSRLCQQSHNVVRQILSKKYITPGKTTTLDVKWALLDLIDEQGEYSWLSLIDVQRRGVDHPLWGQMEDIIIEAGDLLHIDFGMKCGNLNTDMQYIAYICGDDEQDAPRSFYEAYENTRRIQNIYLEEMKTGRTGNQVLRAIRSRMEKEGLEGLIYGHASGYHVHEIGPNVGFTWTQEDTEKGKDLVGIQTTHAMEFCGICEIPEWDGQKVRFYREDEIVVEEYGSRLLAPCQKRLWVVK